MTIPNDKHTPAPEFVAALERSILVEMRGEDSDAAPRASARAPARSLSPFSRTRWRQLDRVAAGVILASGLVLGAGTQLASAQVQAARERGERERTTAVSREVALLRLQLASEAHARAQREFTAGRLSRQSLLEAAAEQRSAELMILRIDSELEEVRLTSAAPRDELWAPLVDGKDFVTQRLQVTAAAARERLSTLEAMLAEADRGARIGVVTVSGLVEVQRQEVQARAEFEFVAQRLRLREQFLKERLSPEEVSRREQQVQLVTDVMRAERLHELAQARLKFVQDRYETGRGVLLDVKRAELEVLERSEEVRQLQLRYRRTTPRPD